MVSSSANWFFTFHVPTRPGENNAGWGERTSEKERELEREKEHTLQSIDTYVLAVLPPPSPMYEKIRKKMRKTKQKSGSSVYVVRTVELALRHIIHFLFFLVKKPL